MGRSAVACPARGGPLGGGSRRGGAGGEQARWRARLPSAIWVVARDGVGEQREPIGVAALVDGDQESTARHVESIWVSPSHRRRGVLRSLIEALAASAGEVDVTTLLLWVMDDNTAAIAAYGRLGFE